VENLVYLLSTSPNTKTINELQKVTANWIRSGSKLLLKYSKRREILSPPLPRMTNVYDSGQMAEDYVKVWFSAEGRTNAPLFPIPLQDIVVNDMAAGSFSISLCARFIKHRNGLESPFLLEHTCPFLALITSEDWARYINFRFLITYETLCGELLTMPYH